MIKINDETTNINDKKLCGVAYRYRMYDAMDFMDYIKQHGFVTREQYNLLVEEVNRLCRWVGLSNIQDVKAATARRDKRLQLFDIIADGRPIQCEMCKMSDIRYLEFDHITGDGKEDRKKFSGSNALWNYYISNPVQARLSLRILCKHCNVKYTTKIGMNRAKANGIKIGRPRLTIEKDELIRLVNIGMSRFTIAKQLGISKATLYKELKRHGIERTECLPVVIQQTLDNIIE